MYARTESGIIYIVLNKYERGRFGEICVQLGNFYTKKFEGEEWENHLKIGNIIDLIEVRRFCKWISSFRACI